LGCELQVFYLIFEPFSILFGKPYQTITSVEAINAASLITSSGSTHEGQCIGSGKAFSDLVTV
jgi:hypothetical protein